MGNTEERSLSSRLADICKCWFPRGCVVESWIGVSVSQVRIPASGI